MALDTPPAYEVVRDDSFVRDSPEGHTGHAETSPAAWNYTGPVRSSTVAFSVDGLPFEGRFTVADLPDEGPPAFEIFQVRLMSTTGRQVGLVNDPASLGALLLSESDADAVVARGLPHRLIPRLVRRAVKAHAMMKDPWRFSRPGWDDARAASGVIGSRRIAWQQVAEIEAADRKARNQPTSLADLVWDALREWSEEVGVTPDRSWVRFTKESQSGWNGSSTDYVVNTWQVEGLHFRAWAQCGDRDPDGSAWIRGWHLEVLVRDSRTYSAPPPATRQHNELMTWGDAQDLRRLGESIGRMTGRPPQG
jgi:hypothetical protein